MEFAYMVDPQESLSGLPYAQMCDMARAAEASGFVAFLRSDHWLSLSGHWDASATDAWTTLAGVARETTTIRLGTLVTPVTFRLPIALAKAVTTVDEMSDGRVEVGLGAGWYEPEHERFGLPFPSIPDRFDMLEEQLEILLGLWTQESVTFEGRHYRLHDAVCYPKPVQQPHPPIVLGGAGKSRSLRLTAAYADEYNLNDANPRQAAEIFGRLAQVCEAAGRPADSVKRSVMIRWGDEEDRLDAGAQRDLAAAYAQAGADRLVVMAWPGAGSVPMIERFGREVIGA